MEALPSPIRQIPAFVEVLDIAAETLSQCDWGLRWGSQQRGDNMSVTATGKAGLDIGKVLQDTIDVLIRNIVPFGGMTLLLVGLPSVLEGVGQYMAPRNPAFGFLTIGAAVATLVTNPLLQCALTYGSMRDLSGSPASIADCLAVGRKRWGSMLGLLILAGLGVGVGLILLIVPGVWLATRWCVSGPVLVMERGRSIGDAMGRSVDLTQGRRLSIFLLFLIYAVIFVVYEAVVIAVAGGFTAVASTPALALVVTPLMNMASILLLTSAVSVIYRRLKGEDTVASGEALGEVFA
jgi:hypothetical protein